MGLLNLKTDLKSLKYGNDQRGGGSSNQPYIVTPIPDGYADTSPDFILRNGYLNPISLAQDVSGFIPTNAAQDVSRLTKLFTDTKSPNGLLFIAKQELLERQNVEIPGGFGRIYNPAGTLAQAGVLSGGYHLNKQGLNPFQQGYFNGGRNGYYQTTLNDNEIDINRLYGLYKLKQIASSNDIPENSLLSKTYNISSSPINIISYGGGPGSVLGVGKTNIRFTGAGYRERTNSYELNDIGNQLNSTNKGIYVFNNKLIDNYLNTSWSDVESNLNINNIEVVDTAKTKRDSNTRIISSFNDYRLAINKTLDPSLENEVLASTDYVLFNRKNTYLQNENGGNRLNPNIGYANDEINLIPPITRNIENSQTYYFGKKINELTDSDITKFFIEVINNDSIDPNDNIMLFFRAYLESINDNFKAEWNSFQYVGRGENFYKYGGFSRDFSLAFKVVATSRAEMIPIYQKLNYLASLTAPSYSEVGLMRGNFINLTIGDYMNNVPCIIQSIGLKPIFEAGWDINRTQEGKIITPNEEDPTATNPYVGQLPKAIDVDLSITPLHQFTPQLNEPYIGNNKHIIPNTSLVIPKTQTPTQDGNPDT